MTETELKKLSDEEFILEILNCLFANGFSTVTHLPVYIQDRWNEIADNRIKKEMRDNKIDEILK